MKRSYLFPLAISTLLLTACGSEENANAQNSYPSVSVHAENVIVTDMPIYLHAVGSVKADKTVYLQSRASGELLEILVNAGDYVEEGQILFKIDKTASEVAYAAARASYESNRAQLKKAKDDLERIKSLSQSSFASDDQREQAQLRVDMLNAAIKADNANLRNANLTLSYADITAPISGKIGAITTDIGNYISPAQAALTTLENTKSVKVDFAVPESELSTLRASFKEGDIPVKAITSAGTEVDGIVTFLGNVNSATGTILMTAKFDNEDSKLWVGQFVDIVITAKVLKDVNTVSEKSVILGPNGLFVYVVEDNAAHIRLVQSSLEDGGRRVISDGLDKNDIIVLDGHVRLFDGARITVAENKTVSSPAQLEVDNSPISPFQFEEVIEDTTEMTEPIITPNPETNTLKPLMETPAQATPLAPISDTEKEEVAESFDNVIAETPKASSIAPTYMPISQSIIKPSTEYRSISAPDVIRATPLSSTPVNNHINSSPSTIAPKTFTPAGSLKPLTEQSALESSVNTSSIDDNKAITTASTDKGNSVRLKFVH